MYGYMYMYIEKLYLLWYMYMKYFFYRKLDRGVGIFGFGSLGVSIID